MVFFNKGLSKEFDRMWKMRKIVEAAFFYEIIFKMADILHDLKIGTFFVSLSYMCDPSFIPFSGTIEITSLLLLFFYV